MKNQKRKKLKEQWKNREPDWGIFTISSKKTGDVFADMTMDTDYAFNRHRFQLSARLHPNKALQALYDLNGDDDLEYKIVEVMKFDDPSKRKKDDLIEFYDMWMEEHPDVHPLAEKKH